MTPEFAVYEAETFETVKKVGGDISHVTFFGEEARVVTCASVFHTIMFGVLSFAILTLAFLAKSHFMIREHLSNILETKNTPCGLNSQGFYDLPTKRLLAEGKATCHKGLLKIPILATNKKINYTRPKDNFELTALLVDFF